MRRMVDAVGTAAIAWTRAYLVTMSSAAVVDMSSDTSPVVAFHR
jgi:hypothetical protein